MEVSIVYWLYRDASFPARTYLAEYVNAHLPMLKRYCHVPYRVVCVTDDPTGLNPKIEAVPMPVASDGDVNSKDPRFPRCYRRLWNWSKDAKLLGERIFSLDVDSVLVNNITPLLEREENLVVWRRADLILGGAYLLRTGTFSHVWENFRFDTSPLELASAGRAQSDQGWLNHMLTPLPEGVGVWTEDDGMRLEPSMRTQRLNPEGTRIVSFGGPHKPWMKSAHQRYPWLARYWTATE